MALPVVVVLCTGCDLGGSSSGGGSTDSYSSYYDSTGYDQPCNFPLDEGQFSDGVSGDGTPIAHTPEPATLTLLGLGIAGLALRYRQRRSK